MQSLPVDGLSASSPQSGTAARGNVQPHEPDDPGAHAGPAASTASGRARERLIRVALGVVLLSSVPALPQLGAPAPVAASCGTGWASRTIPPRTIRVLRTRSGKVQTVDFRRYVAIVMASGEWPSRLPRAALDAGAVATKQYAWYYALKGNHRSFYRTRSGACYDVRDDTNDQLFRPASARPTRKQHRAVRATWPLTLRKRGRFFLTGYRYGSTSSCAADANGWKLYERSVVGCARKGWSSRRIQRAYYEPGLRFVWTPEVWGPAMGAPRVSLSAGNALGTGPATVRWRPLYGPAVAHHRLQRRVGGGRWQDVPLADREARSATVPLRLDRRVRFRVRGVDGQGRQGPWSVSEARKAVLRGPRGATLSGSGTSLFIASGERRSQVARLRFTGRSIAYVAPTGPGMGRAIIKVDGKRVAMVDLERSEPLGERLVWTRNWKRAQERVVVVKPADPDERVEIDGFLVLR